MKLQGILPACVTPFIDGRADPAAMQSNIARWLETGVHGLLVFGSTGEFPYVDDDERGDILRAARAATPSDRLLLAGCGAESTRRTLRYLQEAADAGVDAALVVTPVYYTRGDSEAQRRYFETLADASPIPILLYNVTVFTAYDIPVDLVLDLARHPNIAGMKDSTGDIRRVVSEAQNSGPDFAVFAGSPNLLYPALSMGVAGSITAFGNVVPELMVALWDAVRAGDMQRAAVLQMAEFQLYDALRRYGIPALKAILAHRGFTPGEPRAPLHPLPAELVPEVIAAWEQAMAAVESSP